MRFNQVLLVFKYTSIYYYFEKLMSMQLIHYKPQNIRLY